MCCTAHIPLFLVIIIYCIDNVLFPILHNLPHCAPNHVTGSIGCYCQPMTFACTDQKAKRYPRLKHLSLPQMILCSHSISSELSNNWDWKAMKHTHSQVNVHLLICCHYSDESPAVKGNPQVKKYIFLSDIVKIGCSIIIFHLSKLYEKPRSSYCVCNISGDEGAREIWNWRTPWKNVHVFFFSTSGDVHESLPPPPSTCTVFQFSRMEILHCWEADGGGVGGGGRGRDFRAKKTGNIFDRKRVGMPNFGGFWATWNRYICLPSTEPFNWSLLEVKGLLYLHGTAAQLRLWIQ